MDHKKKGKRGKKTKKSERLSPVPISHRPQKKKSLFIKCRHLLCVSCLANGHRKNGCQTSSIRVPYRVWSTGFWFFLLKNDFPLATTESSLFIGGSWIRMGSTGFYRVLLGFPQFSWNLLGYTKLYLVIPRFTGFYGLYRVLPSYTGFYRVLLGFTGLYLVLLCFTGFYWVASGFTQFYRVLLDFTWFYWLYLVLLGYTQFYCVLLGFTWFYWIFLVLPGFIQFYWVYRNFTLFYWILLGFTGFNWV